MTRKLRSKLKLYMFGLLKEPRRIYLWNKLLSNGVITFGAFSYGVPRILIWDHNTRLYIGKFCSIAEEVTFILGGEHRSDWITTFPFCAFPEEWDSYELKGHPKSKGDIIVGNDVWIGYGATILSGVKIGHGAIVGAKSLVSKDVPNYAIVAGNPARVIGFRFNDSQIDELLKLAWWNWEIEDVKARISQLSSPPKFF